VQELSVATPGGSYPVLVGAGARHRLTELIPVGARRAAVVTQESIPWEVDAGIEQRSFTIGAGEESKDLETIEELCRGFARWGLTRADVVVGVGGGMVTDVAGFAAAVYHRGVAVVHVSTTLLGQVDAAIGGKTGVNLPEGKNLVGAFWQPAAVLCDLETLETLPPREYRSGLGEMAKYAFLGVDRLRDRSLEDAVAACVACKAAFVADDEREQGRRALLNYGHARHVLLGQYGSGLLYRRVRRDGGDLLGHDFAYFHRHITRKSADSVYIFAQLSRKTYHLAQRGRLGPHGFRLAFARML